MKRIALFIILLLASCRLFAAPPSPTPAPSLTLTDPVPTTAVAPTDTLTPTDTPVPLTPSLPAGQLGQEDFILRLHPDGSLHTGDRVSLELVALEPASLENEPVEIEVVEETGVKSLQSQFGGYGIGGRMQATLTWAWNTSGLEPVDYDVNITIPSQDLSWKETVTLLPADQVPPPEPGAAWSVSETECCLVYHITGTAADRDLPEILDMVEEQAEHATRMMGVELEEPIGVVFVPRVLGHGGFAGPEISVSYLDRNYASDNSQVVLHHEIIHTLDARLGGELRPTLFSEGLAVYLTGGHFKPEPLTPRAAALLPPTSGCAQAQDILAGRIPAAGQSVCGLDWYLPLIPLLDNFYLSQHEVGYLQAASLIEFMVDTWGWEAFEAFYRDIHPQTEPPEETTMATDDANLDRGPQAAAVNTALVKHFNITIEQLEALHLAALRKVALQPEMSEDVRLTVDFFDTVRRYQQLLDPSAYFLTAWLPDGKMMREQGIVADYLRRPVTPENLTLETMLVSADAGIQAGDFQSVEAILQSVNAALDSLENGNPGSAWKNGLAAEYFAIVTRLLAAGYQPQQIDLAGSSAQAKVTTSGPELQNVVLEKRVGDWVITGSTQTPAPP